MICGICRGTGRIDVLDVWGISRAVQTTGHMPSIDSAEALPFVPGGAPCPTCVGEDAHDEAIEAMNRKWGDPYNATSCSDEWP